MRNRFYRMLPLLLALLVTAGCAQSAGGADSQASPPASSGTQSIPAPPDSLLKADWPADLAPDELPEYTAGTVTATAVDGDGVLTIKIKDTGKSDLYAYLEILKNTGWIVTSDDTEAEAELALHTVRFDLQRDGTLLQINVYTQEAGSWPADQVPPDILEPSSGTLVGKVEILETMENAWYLNYTYDGMDEAGAQAYLELLMENGWSGEGGQLYKTFEWSGKSYAADIEIYETVETRTTFTCNFYLSAAEPTQAAPSAAAPSSGAPVVGAWTLGMLSGGQFNADTGKYEGGASGMGQIYTFKPDGTYTALVIWSDAIWFTGSYSVTDDVLALTGRTAEESKDGGKTWSEPEALPDASAHFTVGSDETGEYLMLGEEGAAPPLVEKKNAMKYRPQN